VANLKGVLTRPGRNGLDRAQTQTSYQNWGPRIGLAYAMNPKTVIRAGDRHLLLAAVGHDFGRADSA
jgi:hypothetical protein